MAKWKDEITETTDAARILDGLPEYLQGKGFISHIEADAITALRAERDAWKSQCESVEREAAKCFSAQEEIDAAWDAFGTSGNCNVLSLAEQIASHQREVDGARDAALSLAASEYARGIEDALMACEASLSWMEACDAIRALASHAGGGAA